MKCLEVTWKPLLAAVLQYLEQVSGVPSALVRSWLWGAPGEMSQYDSGTTRGWGAVQSPCKDRQDGCLLQPSLGCAGTMMEAAASDRGAPAVAMQVRGSWSLLQCSPLGLAPVCSCLSEGKICHSRACLSSLLPFFLLFFLAFSSFPVVLSCRLWPRVSCFFDSSSFHFCLSLDSSGSPLRQLAAFILGFSTQSVRLSLSFCCLEGEENFSRSPHL